MFNFSRLRLGVQLWLAPGVTLLLLALLAGLASFGVLRQERSLSLVVDTRNPNLIQTIDVLGMINGAYARTYQLLAWSNASFSEAQLKELNKAIRQSALDIPTAAKALQELKGLSHEERQVAELLDKEALKFSTAITKVLEMADVDESVATTMMIQAEAPYQQVLKQVVALRKLQERLAREAASEADLLAESVLWSVFGTATASALLAGILTVAVRRSIMRPVFEMHQAAEQMKSGKLWMDLNSQGRDELSETSQTLGHAMANVRDSIRTVLQAAEQSKLAINEIAQGNQDLSVRTEMQAARLQEASSGMGALAQAVIQTAGRSHTLLQVTRESKLAAHHSSEVVEEAVHLMAMLTKSATQIRDIIGVIDTIAFQTNILALNASVESARAGEHGRGFAVVASEVRGLARRCSEAANEIKELISTSVGQIEKGGSLINHVGSSMQKVLSSADNLVSEVNSIHDATQSQSQELSRLRELILDVDTATQQNAALVEEVASAADSLRDESNRLVDSVMVFQIDEFTPDGELLQYESSE